MDVAIIRNGNSYSLTVQADEGLGMAPLHRLQERGPMQHGASDAGYRLDPRTFNLAIPLRGQSLSNLYSLRETLLNWLQPAVDISLLFTRGDGEERQIDCAVIDAPMGHDVTQVWAAQVIVARFRAADPTFYDPTAQTSLTLSLSDTSGATVPMSVPLGVGVSELDDTDTITYTGNIWSYPHRIRITGPITNPIVTNVSTGHKLEFTGCMIGNGEYYDIDLRYGYKTVQDSGGTDRRYQLTDDSDLATWHLAPDPEVADGDNEIRAQGLEVDAATEVNVTYYVRYLGI